MTAFTIAIPTLNRCTLLKKALDSALNQTTKAKILVSDNGSIDGTRTLLTSYLNHPNSIRMIHHNSTMPVQHHSWEIISRIDTPWVIFLSDDDYLENDFIEQLSAVLHDNSHVALIYTGCDIIYDTVRVPAKVGPRFELASSFLLGFMSGQRNICMCATAFRVDDLRRIGPQPDHILIGDMYYWARILTPGRIVGCASGHHCNYLMYTPGHSSETNRAALTPWARESESLSYIISNHVSIEEVQNCEHSEIDVARKHYLAITIANHFIFSALRNTARTTLISNFCELRCLLLNNHMALIRVIGAIILPRFFLNWIVILAAYSSKKVAKASPL